MDGGSVAWSNSVRSRLSLERPGAEDGDSADPDARLLSRKKGNYASISESIRLRWEQGVLTAAYAPGGFAAMAQAADAEQVFLELLARTETENRPVSDSAHSGNSAVTLFSKRPDRKGMTRKDLEGAMQRLFANGKICMQEYGRRGANGLPRRIVRVQP